MGRLEGSDLVLFHRGDEDTFRRIVEEHSPRLLAVARSFAADLDEAHDLVQETWQRAYAKRATYQGSGTLLGWLFAVCRSVCRSALKRRRFQASSPVEPEDTLGLLAAPDRMVERAELRRSVHLAVMQLPDRERDVVILRILAGKSTRETASELRCAEGTVKAALHHAVQKLQAAMEVWA